MLETFEFLNLPVFRMFNELSCKPIKNKLKFSLYSFYYSSSAFYRLSGPLQQQQTAFILPCLLQFLLNFLPNILRSFFIPSAHHCQGRPQSLFVFGFTPLFVQLVLLISIHSQPCLFAYFPRFQQC